MTAVQDMHIDLIHVLYVYSRVMGGGGGGGGVITKYSRGVSDMYVYVASYIDIYKTHALQ